MCGAVASASSTGSRTAFGCGSPFSELARAFLRTGSTSARLARRPGRSDQARIDSPVSSTTTGRLSELQTVTTRNAPTARLDQQLALQLLESKVRRAVFQTGFFGVRGLEIRARSLDYEFHVPYWLGFFGHGERATLQAMDAVRRTFEGAKARAVFSDWLAG